MVLRWEDKFVRESDGVRDYTIIVYIWQCELGEAAAAATSTLSTRCPQGKHRKTSNKRKPNPNPNPDPNHIPNPEANRKC